MIKYSFIIPVKEINDYIRESIGKTLEIKRDDFEIIICSDKESKEIWEKTKQIASGPVGPATKRTLAAKDVQGEILIFIDDDAYPRSDFLNVLDKDFFEENVVAVGGPAMTPLNSSHWEKVSGAVFLSVFGGGHPERYIPKGEKRFIDDWPSVNLSVKKSAFEKVGGFDSRFWPGEDTKLCLDLIGRLGGKILYDPDLVVFHHRRGSLLAHLKQVGGYGLHRGFFAKEFPRNSFKLKYFVPTLFFLFVIFGGILSLLSPFVLKIYFIGWLLYLAALAKAAFDILKYEKNILIISVALSYIFLTHLVYGLRFIQGFVFVKNLKSKLR